MNRLIEWFARNGIAANLLMVVIMAGGLLTVGTLKQEVFPEFSSDVIQATVEYLGAAPEEVEEGVCVRIEEAVYGLAGVKRITSSAQEGVGVVTVELLPSANPRQLLDEIKTRVDAIDTFPEETEKPVVEEALLRRQVINVAVSGNTDERSLRRVAERVRDELSALPGISLVQLSNARPYEISIEIAEERLRRHGLTFDDVARAVRRSSLDLPGGSVKTVGGEILVRTKGQAYEGREFEEVTVLARSDGTRLLLGEVATVVDDFADTDQAAMFDGQPAILLNVFRVGEQSALGIAETVKEYVEEARHRVPEGIHLTPWADDAAVLKSRLHLLVDNGLMGLVLVCLALALFLRLKLALWVAWGIPLSFLGAVWLLPTFGISINLISLFAFIVVLGIVVDDAIIVGENIYTHIQKGKEPLAAAIEGAQEVAVPVIFAVLTSVVAFAPLLSVPGNTGKIMAVIPAIVIATLAFSLIESLLVLPAHLSRMRREGDSKKASTSSLFGLLNAAWSPINHLVGTALKRFIEKVYSPALELALRWRYLTLAVAIASLLFTASWVFSSRIKLVFFPPVDADNVVAMVTLPQGTPVEATARALVQLEEAALEMLAEFRAAVRPGQVEASGGAPAAEKPNRIYRHVLRSIGGQPYREAMNQKRGKSRGFSGSHLGEVNIELVSAEERSATGTEMARRWRELAGPVPDAVELLFTSSLFSTGNAIDIQLSAPSVEKLRQAADLLKARLGEFAGVTDITDSFRAGKQEIKLGIKPEAETLGLSLSDLARQVRQGFYGEEAQRIQRGRDDVKVMVRYPREKRRSLGGLESMRIRAADGAEVDFSEVATAELGRGYATIQRADRQRIINVSADVDQSEANANEILAELSATSLPQLVKDFPGLTFSLEGEQREQRETFGGLASGFVLALLGIYALLAIPFRSYFQPLIVMGVIPFGIVGVVWGHMLLGLPLTLLSMFGLVALTGVVVNDSLIMVDFVNRARRRGLPVEQALRQAGTVRFRPILLTSLTTFVGLSPLLFEKSMQAQFLIPMAASLGFGVVFATFVTLILVPVGYLMLEDFVKIFRQVYATGDSESGSGTK